MFDDLDNSGPFVTITRIDGKTKDDKPLQPENPQDIPVLPTRNLILFPDVTAPISLSRESSKAIAQAAHKRNVLIGIVCQKDPIIENPELEDLVKYGVLARVLNVIKLPNGSDTAIVQAVEKFRIVGRGLGQAIPEAPISASVKMKFDRLPSGNDKRYAALASTLKETAVKLTEHSGEVSGVELSMNLRNIDDPLMLVNTVASMFPLDQNFKLHLLSLDSLRSRTEQLLEELLRREYFNELSDSIRDKARKGMEGHQRDAYLHEQLEAIREELYGEDNEDIEKILESMPPEGLPEHVKKIFDKEVEKLRRMSQQHPEYSVQINYLEYLVSLPWSKESKSKSSLPEAKKILDKDHFGLEKVKQRIIEQLAVILNNPDVKSPIICFVGPPGVGKTSLGKSIARALNRNYQRVALGGVHDEAEIRGHRRTYIGSLPGRIIDAVKRADTRNPVLLLDEIDKLGHDFKGDPSSALLEVLDPEQNYRFHDNYVDVDFDLSKVFFIATANTLSSIPQPLIDRMEIIELSGYLEEEKVEIAKKYLVPKNINELGMTNYKPRITDNAIREVIRSYTSESGVRQLEKNLASLMRKYLVKRLNDEPVPKTIGSDNVKEMLGVPVYSRDRYENNDFAGVVTGLAWTAAGGEILYIETSLIPGKGDKLSVTGNLGDVMKESATLALQYVKSHHKSLEIDSSLFERFNIHIHVPEGAIPKDGPSAGITMVTSIVSALKQVRVRNNLAMTGEITLRGKVLPVGGIKEKILAAKRAGIDTIILCKENRKNVEDIPEKYVEGLKFHYFDKISEVLEFALTDEKPVDAIDLLSTDAISK